jgi:hypothetical protein
MYTYAGLNWKGTLTNRTWYIKLTYKNKDHWIDMPTKEVAELIAFRINKGTESP